MSKTYLEMASIDRGSSENTSEVISLKISVSPGVFSKQQNVKLKSVRAKTEPGGTPHVPFKCLAVELPLLTMNLLSVRYDLDHLRTFLKMFITFSLLSKILWLTRVCLDPEAINNLKQCCLCAVIGIRNFLNVISTYYQYP